MLFYIFLGSNKNINYFKNSEKNSAKISSYQSSWHTPVSPAVWVKNVKLAPLDMSRLPNSKNRYLENIKNISSYNEHFFILFLQF